MRLNPSLGQPRPQQGLLILANSLSLLERLRQLREKLKRCSILYLIFIPILRWVLANLLN
jgi:hypothetical protein